MKTRLDPWLFAVFVVCSLFAAVLVYRAREWTVMTDELLYTEMARGMLATGLPLPNVRGEYVQVYQVLYPMLIAPVLLLVGMPEAYQAIAVVNAVAITSACVPAYLLTMYVTDERAAARWVAVCVGVLPWLALATKILTDSLAYPLFMWALYAIVRATAEGDDDRRRDWIALAAIAAAYLARSQFVVLPVVFCAAIAARAFAAGAAGTAGSASSARTARTVKSSIAAGLRELVRAPLRRWPVFALTLIVVLTVALKPQWILGVYSATTGDEFGAVVPSGLLGQMGSHLGMIAIGVGLVPLLLALPWIVAAIGRAGDARQNATALSIAICSLVLLFVAASFDARFSRTAEIYERYIFYLAPMLLVAAAALFKHPPKHWAGFVVPALAGLLIFARDDHYGLDDQLTISLNHSFKPVAIFQIALQRAIDASGFLPSVTTAIAILTAIIAALAAVAIVKGRGRQAMHAMFAIVLAYCVWASVFTVPKVVARQNHDVDSLLARRDSAQKTWIDAAAGSDDVSLVYGPVNLRSGRPSPAPGIEKPVFWDAELWNSSILSYYTPFADRGIARPTMTPYHRLRVGFEDGSIRLTGGEPAGFWLMSSSDPRFAPLPPAPAPAKHDSKSGLTLHRVPRVPRADWATRGLTFSGFVAAGRPAVLRVFADPAGHGDRGIAVTLLLERKRRAIGTGQPAAKRINRPSATRSFTQTVCPPAGGHADIDLARLARPLIDDRHVARMLRVKVDRDARDGC